MLAANVASAASNGAKAVDIWNCTVEEFSATTRLTGENKKPQEPCWFMALVSEKTTSPTVSGVPSKNLTPGRRWKSAVNPLGATDQLVASSGTTLLPSGESATSRSYICISVKIDSSSCVLYGSNVKMSACRANTSVPPCTGVPAAGAELVDGDPLDEQAARTMATTTKRLARMTGARLHRLCWDWIIGCLPWSLFIR